MSRDELGALLGVGGQVVGSWERQGTNHLAALPREAAATRAAKARLPETLRFMTAVASVKTAMANGELVPAPCDWLPILSKGDPLILSGEPAVEGDLVLLRDTSGDFNRIARVLTERENGKLMVFTRPYKVAELPEPDDYRTIEYNLSRQHDGIPDQVLWTQNIPPDLI